MYKVAGSSPAVSIILKLYLKLYFMNKIIIIYKILILIFFATTGLFFHQWNLAQNEIEDLKKQIFILNKEQLLLREQLLNKSVIDSIPVDVITNEDVNSTIARNLVDTCIIVGGGILFGLLVYTVLQSLFGVGGSSGPSMSHVPTTNQVPVPSTPVSDTISETAVNFVGNSSELINNVVQNSLSQSIPRCLPTSEAHPVINECLQLIMSNPSNLSLVSIEYGLRNQCYANLIVNNSEIIELVHLKLKLAGVI